MRAAASGVTFAGMVEVDVIMAASRSGSGDALSLPERGGRAQVTAEGTPRELLNLLRHHKRRPVRPPQQGVGCRVTNNRFIPGVHRQRAAEPVPGPFQLQLVGPQVLLQTPERLRSFLVVKGPRTRVERCLRA